ncbi:MAG: hypothetical protein IPM25_06170 [Chloracidobacterium sp.]|nr:hypothetical protein [Chloracidobacterium sp.]
MKSSLILVLLLLAHAIAVSAQIAGNPENWCREGFFTRDSTEFKIGIIKKAGNSRAYFHNDDGEGCPGAASCKSKAYIINNDKVVVNREYGRFSCVWFSPVRGRPTIGWIETADLVWVKTPLTAGLSPWLGKWGYAENSISFTNNKLPGFLNVTGSAFWKGVGDNIHVGELDGRFEAKNGLLNYSDGDSEYDCKASMRLIGDFLIVTDNLNCGGVNVSFSGVYLKKKSWK